VQDGDHHQHVPVLEPPGRMDQPRAAHRYQRREEPDDRTAHGRIGITPQRQRGNRQCCGQRGTRDAGPGGGRGEEAGEGVRTEIAREEPDLEVERGELAEREGRRAQRDEPGAARTERARRGVAPRREHQPCEDHSTERDRKGGEQRTAEDAVGEVREALHGLTLPATRGTAGHSQ